MEKCEDKKRVLKKSLITFGISLVVTVILFAFCFSVKAYASPSITVDLSAGEASNGAFGPIEMLFLLVVLALAPSMIVLMTSFTRIVIVLSFLRNALGTQQSPPNQVIVGLALILSLFIMAPVLEQISDEAYTPYKNGAISSEVAMKKAVRPLKVFMLKQTRQQDLALFLSISKTEQKLDPATIATPEEMADKLGLSVVVPSFVTSELQKAFTIGFLLFIPFLIIDMVVSSTLMSMGMVMLPPSMIALPFKIMTFVIVDGWGLLLGTLAKGFK